jgi:catalase (peroxidase I)
MEEKKKEAPKPSSAPGDYEAVKKAIADLLDADYDDGSYGPVFIRLAWHASGSYDKASKTGGSNGATMRFKPESDHGANAGLAHARDRLEPVKKQFPWITYADLWTLAGCVAIEEMGGPKIEWRAGRSDAADGKVCPPDGRLPDAAQGEKHVRDVFYRMGFDDKEIVALLGAHSMGRAHKDRSGYHGPWTHAPTTVSNEYYRLLLEEKWTEKKWDGPKQLEDSKKELMMVPADMAMVQDKEFKKYVELYAKDENAWRNDFAKAFAKLIELGVPRGEKKEASAPAPAKAKEEPKKEESKGWFSGLFGGKSDKK